MSEQTNTTPEAAAPAAAPVTTSQTETLLAPKTEAAPAPATTETAAPTVNGDEVHGWMKDMPDDLKGNASLKRYTDIQSLAKAYINSEKMIGKDKVVLPDQHATDEDWQNFFQKVGLPESVDKYEVKGPKDAKYVEAEAIAELKPLAHKLGILPKQLEGILNWYEERSGKVIGTHTQAEQAKLAGGVADLKKEWGQAFDTKLSWAARLMDENAIDGLEELRNNPQFGSNPVLLKFLAKVGEGLYKEDTIRNGEHGGRFILSPAEAQERINAITGDSAHPYFNPEHPNHSKAVDEVKKLYDTAHYSGS